MKQEMDRLLKSSVTVSGQSSDEKKEIDAEIAESVFRYQITYTYDGMGRLTRQTDPVDLRPGECYIVNIKREDLRVPGEELTGRLLVSTVIQVVSMDGSTRPVNLHVSMERVDRSGSSSSGGIISPALSRFLAMVSEGELLGIRPGSPAAFRPEVRQ